MLNSYYKEASDPNLKSFIKQSVEGFLRENIKSGIEQIFAQNKELYKDASALFSTALSDYATMKEALKTIDRLKVRDEAKSKAQALSNIYKYLQGQGGEVSNIQNLTKGLNPAQKANFEVALLYGMFQKTLLSLGKDRVFNSRAFFENLDNLAMEFGSKEAKDFIEIARGFDTLFKNDALIAQSLGAALPKEVGSSIATSIEGAAKFQMVKMGFEALMRLMPHIPFAKGFNEKIQGMALRFNLRKALSQSSDISEFKFTLKRAGENPSINSPTRELINKITKEVNEAQDEMIEGLEREGHKQILRAELATTLEPLIGKDIVNANDGRIAQISKKNIAKMGSDAAIQKSVNNGFSPEQHFEASKQVDSLFEKATFKQSSQDTKSTNPNVWIHRYSAQIDKDTSAIITLKESIDKDTTRIYTLELESLAKPNATQWGDSNLAKESKDFDTSPNSSMSLDTSADSTTTLQKPQARSDNELIPNNIFNHIGSNHRGDGLPNYDTTIPSTARANQRGEYTTKTRDRDTPNADTSSQGERQTTGQIEDIPFRDSKGKEHTLTKETQAQWLKTFELENLEQSYIPKHSEEIRQALGGKEIRLQKGSLLKLDSQGREEFIPQIKAVLDEPEAILRDSDNSFLFVKHLKDEDYFVNVSVDKGEYAVSISNGIKEAF